MGRNLIIIGAGGHAKACVDLIEENGEYNIIGALDDNRDDGLLSYPIIGKISKMTDHFTRLSNFVIAIGQIRTDETRKAIFDRLYGAKQNIPNIISKKASVSHYAQIGVGVQIFPFAFIGVDSKIGDNCIINTKALIEHDCVIGNNVHIAPGACVIGGINICDGVFVGSNSTVIDHITEPGVYVGSPARRLK